MTSPPAVIPREGEIAFAVSVATLYDMTLGRINWPVWLRKTDIREPLVPPLTLSNVTPGGSCLDILSADGLTVVTRFTNLGIDHTQVGSHIDLHYVPEGQPPAPGAGTQNLRMYARGGQLYFKAEDSLEQQIPVGSPEAGSVWRHAYWFAGG